MATEESNKFTPNLKVPPLKIVLSSHQSNSVMNVSRVSIDKDDSNNIEHGNGEQEKELSRRASIGANADEPSISGDRQSSKKGSRTNSNRNLDNEQSAKNAAEYSSASSSSSTVSDRSTSTSPSSESESLASNSTIISEQQVKTNVKSESSKDDVATVKSETRTPRNRGTNSERSGSFVSSERTKRSSEGQSESSNVDSGTNDTKDHKLNSNQRITRSSQRAAQQNKTDSQVDAPIEDLSTVENQEKNSETARKAKRRKGEPQENEPEGNQSAAPQPVAMANICPADYQLPAQNSFELFRDIRERPHKKMMELNHIQPKVPYGFKDYLINGGPYLLDGNKLGVGLYGMRIDSNQTSKVKTKILGRDPIRMRIANLKKKYSAHQPSHQRHDSYQIPKLADAPKSLPSGSPLHELFIDQERARQQMRMQHLKERERSIMAAEQEILRAYNKVAIADVGQKLHLSACTYFYYQERYHYLDDKTNPSDKNNLNEVPHSQDNSFLCIEGGETSKVLPNGNESLAKTADTTKTQDLEDDSTSNDETTKQKAQDSNSVTVKKESGGGENTNSKSEGNEMEVDPPTKSKNSPGLKPKTEETKSEANDNHSDETLGSKETKGLSEKSAPLKDHNNETTSVDSSKQTEKPIDKQQEIDSDSGIAECAEGKQNNSSDKMTTSEDSKEENRRIFLDQLQDIDEKWANIRKEMCVRHKNEADSLFAIQSLDWEWKAKEIGFCDVRVTLQVDPEFVPRVEVSSLDY